MLIDLRYDSKKEVCLLLSVVGEVVVEGGCRREEISGKKGGLNSTRCLCLVNDVAGVLLCCRK